MFVGFKAIEQGASHIETEKPCQDAAETKLDTNNTFGMAFVADGHGGEKYIRSAAGSKIAVDEAKKAVSRFYEMIASEKTAFFAPQSLESRKKEKQIDQALLRLKENIVYAWREEVHKHFYQYPPDEKEKSLCNDLHLAISADTEDDIHPLYGTTLLAALVTQSFWFALQIGDGLCVKINADGTPSVAVPDDECLAFGCTTSLCDADAVSNFRHAFGFEKILGITVATDGVVDSFEPEKYLAFTTDLRQKFISFPDTVEGELQKFLPELSKQGSRDDVAIAGVWRIGESHAACLH